MFKGHPKGLYVAFFANMGERFGFYTMMAILVLFLQARYGLKEEAAGNYYSWFYFGIYALALVGGTLADISRKYKTVILAGIIVMFAGYLIMAIPGNPLTLTLIGLFTIAFGNGLFKGNLQAVVGQMYESPEYKPKQESAYMIFYMGINVGAFFAPFAATGIRNWMLKINGFSHDGSLPAMCHQYLSGTLKDVTKLQDVADKANLAGPVADLSQFAHSYLDVFSRGYNYAFGIAAGAMVISLLVYIIFNKLLPTVAKIKNDDPNRPKAKANVVSFLLGGGLMITTSVIFYFLLRNTIRDAAALGAAVGLFIGFVAIMFQISTKEERPKVTSLIMVFIVVIFFWMSFHQNGLTLTFFARDYTVKQVDAFTNIFFNLESILSFIAAIAGFILIFKKKLSERLIGAGMFLAFGALTYYFIIRANALNPITPEIFQSFNPLFIVSLTFPVMGVFAWLRKKNMEPSSPKKIGIGMIIAAIGFLIVLIASISLISPYELKFIDETGAIKYNPVPDSSRVLPYWLISGYLVLTIAELFLSPMGLSFVAKVAPVRFQGLMQGGWLLATAVGNKFLFVGSKFWGVLDLWQLWSIFIVCCILSAIFIFSIMKRLEAATK
jgi:POT family proton-dependent oligopeptide transporter